MMRTWFNRFDTWWSLPVQPHALAIVRCCWGVFCFIYLARFLPHVSLLFSADGVTVPLLADRVPSFVRVFFQPPPVSVALLLFGLLLLCQLSFAIGYRMRLSTALIVLLSLFFWQLSLHHFVATFHRFYLFAFLVFLLGGADQTFSVRMWHERGSWTAWEPISILPQRLLTVQLTLTYAGAALQKLWLPDWQSGAILEASLLHAGATPLAYFIAGMQWPPALFDGLIWLLKLFEITLPIGLWVPRFRPWAIAGGTVFHLLIALLFSIWSFLAFIPLYLLFVPPDAVQRALFGRQH